MYTELLALILDDFRTRKQDLNLSNCLYHVSCVKVFTWKCCGSRYSSRRVGSTPSGRGLCSNCATGYVERVSLASSSSTFRTSPGFRPSYNAGNKQHYDMQLSDQTMIKILHWTAYTIEWGTQSHWEIKT